MQKTAIIVYGVANQGKTSTINNVAALIAQNYPGAVITPNILPPYNGDRNILFNIGTAKIGIESHGDISSQVIKSLNEFVSKNCNIIICCTRTSGQAVSYMQQMKNTHGYRILWLANYYSEDINNVDLNSYTADHIYRMMLRVLSGEI